MANVQDDISTHSCKYVFIEFYVEPVYPTIIRASAHRYIIYSCIYCDRVGRVGNGFNLEKFARRHHYGIGFDMNNNLIIMNNLGHPVESIIMDEIEYGITREPLEKNLNETYFGTFKLPDHNINGVHILEQYKGYRYHFGPIAQYIKPAFRHII